MLDTVIIHFCLSEVFQIAAIATRTRNKERANLTHLAKSNLSRKRENAETRKRGNVFSDSEDDYECDKAASSSSEDDLPLNNGRWRALVPSFQLHRYTWQVCFCTPGTVVLCIRSHFR